MSSTVASGSAAPSPSSIDPRQLLGSTPDYTKSSHYLPPAPVDATFLSSYHAYQQYNNSSSPSGLDTPAHVASENSVYSGFSDFGVDEFFGVDFDAEGHSLLFDGEVIEDIATSMKEFPAVELYPSEAIHDTGATPSQSNTLIYPNSAGSPKASPNSNQPAVLQTSIARVAGPSDGLNSASSPSTMSFNPSVNDTMDQLATPGISGNSSLASAEDVANNLKGIPGHSPRVTLTTWGSMEARELSVESEYHNTIDMIASQEEHGYFGTRDTPSSGTYNARVSAPRSSNESWDDDGASARSGVDPIHRKSFSDVEVPNFKDQAKKDEFEAKRRDVEEWRSQAGDSTDAVDEGPSHSYAMLNTPSPNRARSLSTGAVPSNQNSPHGLMARRNIEPPRIHTPGPDDGSSDGEGIRPVSPTESIRENRLLEGQVYYNKTAANIRDDDIALMQLSRHWNDGPAYPHIITPAMADDDTPVTNESEHSSQNANDDGNEVQEKGESYGQDGIDELSEESGLFVAQEDSKNGGNEVQEKGKRNGENGVDELSGLVIAYEYVMDGGNEVHENGRNRFFSDDQDESDVGEEPGLPAPNENVKRGRNKQRIGGFILSSEDEANSPPGGAGLSVPNEDVQRGGNKRHGQRISTLLPSSEDESDTSSEESGSSVAAKAVKEERSDGSELALVPDYHVDGAAEGAGHCKTQ